MEHKAENLTVLQAVENFKLKYSSQSSMRKPTTIVYCPHQTIQPRIGKEYILTKTFNQDVPEILKNQPCDKIYRDSLELMVIFRNTKEIQDQIEHEIVYQ